MTYVVKLLRQSKILIKLVSLYRGLLSENKIPDILFERLKYYIPELSENIPDIDKLNKYIESDIAYLNSREELIYINWLKKTEESKKGLLYSESKSIKRKAIKYYDVKIVGYEDIIEVDAVRDRVFTMSIKMDDANSSINNIFCEESSAFDKNFYYRVKLGTLKSIFQLNKK